MSFSFLLAGALAFASSAQPAGGPATAYRALGTEPFWGVTIERGRMTYHDAEGRRFSVPTPTARPSFNGRRYITRRLTVDITRQRCSDGMSDRSYADTVRVVADGRRLSGCGGAYTNDVALAGTRWRIVAINGAAVPAREWYTIRFEGDRLTGMAGCNHFSGGYRLDNGRLIAGPIASTRMACQGPRGRDEQAVLRALAAPLRFAERGEGMIELTSNGGTLRLRQVR